MQRRANRWVRIGVGAWAGMAIAGMAAGAFSGETHQLRRPQVPQTHGHWVVDKSDDRKLAGFADVIFFGRVTEKVGKVMYQPRSLPSGNDPESRLNDERERSNNREVGFPETQFRVDVLRTLKGSVADTVIVNQLGGVRARQLVFVDPDDRPIEPGKRYLFAARFYQERGWLTLVPTAGNIEVRDEAHAQELLKRFEAAVREQIPFDLGDGDTEE